MLLSSKCELFLALDNFPLEVLIKRISCLGIRISRLVFDSLKLIDSNESFCVQLKTKMIFLSTDMTLK